MHGTLLLNIEKGDNPAPIERQVWLNYEEIKKNQLQHCPTCSILMKVV